MSKREYVEFTGILPKELVGAKKPIYGRVVKRSKSKGFVTVKPKHREYEVTVSVDDVTVVPYEKFHKKHKKKRKAATKKPVAKKNAPSKVTKAVKEAKKVVDSPVAEKKSAEKKSGKVVPMSNGAVPKKEDCPTKKEVTLQSGDVKVKGDGPVKVQPKPGTHPPFRETVKEKIAEGEQKVAEKPTPEVVKQVKADEDAVKEVCDKPSTQELIEDQGSGGGVLIWVVVALIGIAAAAAWYFLT
jgi:hypothetical protein